MGIKLRAADFIYPYFVIEGKNKQESIPTFPGVYRFSIDRLIKDVAVIRRLGISKVLLFGVSREKDPLGLNAYALDSLIGHAVRRLRNEFPDLVVMSDICLCAYTTHGHCGILKTKAGPIDNSATVKKLAQMALVHADSGVDWVAPSAMAEGQVKEIRRLLDSSGYKRVKILGYSAKFASNFYGPFRKAANSAPAFGDRSAYQLNYADSRQAFKEIKNDIQEGADAVMVKPALGYLDVISGAKQRYKFPLVAYNVSGEYSMVKLGANQGLWNEGKMIWEILTSIKRAGADWIITYHAKEFLRNI